MSWESRRRIDMLLRQEPVDRLRELLREAETDYSRRTDSVVEFLQDADSEILQCVTAISRVRSHCTTLIESSHKLKLLQSALQNSLLAASSASVLLPSDEWRLEGAFKPFHVTTGWTGLLPDRFVRLIRGEDDIANSPKIWVDFVTWTKIPSDAWEAHTTLQGLLLNQRVASLNEIVRCFPAAKLLAEALNELPRVILEMLNNAEPLQGFCALSAFGARSVSILERFLGLLPADVAKQSQIVGDTRELLEMSLKRIRAYFPVNDFITQMISAGLSSFEQPALCPLLHLQMTPRETVVCLHNWKSLSLCSCIGCRPLLRKYWTPGFAPLVETITLLLLTRCHTPSLSSRAILNAFILARGRLLDSLLNEGDLAVLDSQIETTSEAAAESSDACELLIAAFDTPPAAYSSSFEFIPTDGSTSAKCQAMKQSIGLRPLVEMAFRIAAAIEVYENSAHVLAVAALEETGSSNTPVNGVMRFPLEDAGLRLLGVFTESVPGDVTGLSTALNTFLGGATIAWNPRVDVVEGNDHEHWQKALNTWHERIVATTKGILERAERWSSAWHIIGFWRTIYAVVMTTRVYWADVLPFGGIFATGDSVVGKRAYMFGDTLQALLGFSELYKWWKTTRNETHKGVGLLLPLEYTRSVWDKVEDVLPDVAKLFKESFGTILRKESENVIFEAMDRVLLDTAAEIRKNGDRKTGEGDEISSAIFRNITTLKNMDRTMSTLLMLAVAAAASSSSWTSVLGEAQSSIPPILPSDAKFCSVFVRTLANQGSDNEALMVLDAFCNSLSQNVKKWIERVCEGTSEEWAVRGVVAALLGESCKTPPAALRLEGLSAVACDSTKAPLPFLTWVVHSLRSTDKCRNDQDDNWRFGCSGASLLDCCTSRLLTAELTAEAGVFLDHVKADASIISRHYTARAATRVAVVGSEQQEGCWKYPRTPRPAVVALTFDCCFALTVLQKRLDGLRLSTSVTEGIIQSCRQSAAESLKAVACAAIYLSLSGGQQSKRPVLFAVQTLFDLEFIEVVCNAQGISDLRSSGGVNSPVSFDKRDISVSELKACLRARFFVDVVDQLLYEDSSFRDLAKESIKGLLLLVHPLICDTYLCKSSDHTTTPAGEAGSTGDVMLVAPLSTRVPLLPVPTAATQMPLERRIEVAGPGSLGLEFGNHLFSPPGPQGSSNAAIEPLAGLTMRERGERFLGATASMGVSSSAATAAADFGTSAYKNVSTLSSFIRDQVEGLSSAVSEAIKTRAQPQQNNPLHLFRS